jgi:starch-binding outer membrane protein, SusD/RagB family
MKKNINILFTGLMLLLFSTACKDQLDIKNPNNPTPASASTESGLVSLAKGSIYLNGFTFSGNKYGDGVLGSYFNGMLGIHEMMGDIVAAEAANSYMNQISCPDMVTLDNGTAVPNPNSPNTFKALIRSVNVNAQQGGNPGFHEWAFMYQLNNSANNILALVDKTTFVGDAATKKAVLKAWAYFWKGFAYSKIGSMYYAGLIIDTPGATNGNYVTKEKMIDEANANFDKASGAFNGLAGKADYSALLGKLIPDFFQSGHGGVPTPTEWQHTINTMKARNLLANTTTAAMTAAQWSQVLTLTNAGVTDKDVVFNIKANGAGDVFSPSSYNVAARAVGANATGGTYKISERFIQDFNKGDKRLAQNFKQFPAWIGNQDRGNSFNTRWAIIDKGTGLDGVYTYSNRTALEGELIIGGSYEENELMKAEAKLWTGDAAGAKASIDAVRAYQGSGLDKTTATTVDEIKEELRKERRVALAFRGLSFYDARRWGIINTGRSNAVVLDKAGIVNTKATIKYGYLDYWDVPDNELAYNPAAAGSAPIVNPNK